MITFSKELPEPKSFGTPFPKYLIQDYQLLLNKMQTKFRGLICHQSGGVGGEEKVSRHRSMFELIYKVAHERLKCS